MTNERQVSCSFLNRHTKSACLPMIEYKSTLDLNRKLLQALDDGKKCVLSKNVNNHIHFQM